MLPINRRTNSEELTRIAAAHNIPLDGVLRYTQIPWSNVSNVYYVDSYGMPPPQRIPRFSGRIDYTERQFQPVVNQSCGMFALASCYLMAKNVANGVHPLHRVTAGYDKPLATNDDIAVRLIKKKKRLIRLPQGHSVYIANLDRYGNGIHWVAIYTINGNSPANFTDAVRQK